MSSAVSSSDSGVERSLMPFCKLDVAGIWIMLRG